MCIQSVCDRVCSGCMHSFVRFCLSHIQYRCICAHFLPVLPCVFLLFAFAFIVMCCLCAPACFRSLIFCAHLHSVTCTLHIYYNPRSFVSFRSLACSCQRYVCECIFILWWIVATHRCNTRQYTMVCVSVARCTVRSAFRRRSAHKICRRWIAKSCISLGMVAHLIRLSPLFRIQFSM